MVHCRRAATSWASRMPLRSRSAAALARHRRHVRELLRHPRRRRRPAPASSPTEPSTAARCATLSAWGHGGRAIADCFYVDAGATYSGAAATTISGLSHLVGETVAILADGGPAHPDRHRLHGHADHRGNQGARRPTVSIRPVNDAAGIADRRVRAGRNKNLNKVWPGWSSPASSTRPQLDNLVPSDAY